jgi:L-galactose dehydrogenase
VARCREAVEFCRSAGVDIVKLAVQFSVAQPGIATTLIGTANPENIRRNVEWALAPADSAGIAAVLEILRPIHNHNFTRGRLENRDLIIDETSDIPA